MDTAFDVALRLLHLSSQEADEPEPMTPLRLQKLLYYVQGWSLAVNGDPMFTSSVEAWTHGPVVPEVYRRFKQYGSAPISTGDFATQPKLNQEQAKFVASVWESYKEYSATKLRSMTHHEPPWTLARSGYAPNEHCNVEITHQSMRDYFLSRANIPGITQEEAWMGFEDAKAGKTVSISEAFRLARNE